MIDILPTEVKEVMRDNAHNLLEIMIEERVPFRIVIWNNNNWDNPLPENVMDAFPMQLVLDIKEMALDESYIDASTGEIILVTMFEGKEYEKVVDYEEIVAILDLSGQPYILNNFEQDNIKPDKVFSITPTSKEDIINQVVQDGVPKEAAARSVSAFFKHNPELAKNLKDKYDN